MSRLCVFLLICVISVCVFTQAAWCGNKFEEQVAALTARVGALEARATAAEAQVASLSQALTALEPRVTALERGPVLPASEPQLLSDFVPAPFFQFSGVIGDTQGNFAVTTIDCPRDPDTSPRGTCDWRVMLFDGRVMRQIGFCSAAQTYGADLLAIDHGRVLWQECPKGHWRSHTHRHRRPSSLGWADR